MKRYLLFAGSTYYPSGGWADFVGSYDTLQEATIAALPLRRDWGQIVDGTTGEVLVKWGQQ